MDYKKRDQKTLPARKEQFVRDGKAKHGEDTYDYSLAIQAYTNNRTPVPLICNKCKGEPFLVIPFRHTEKGDNKRGSCPNCYVPDNKIQESRWNPNRLERARALRDELIERHNGKYSYPFIEEEFKNDESRITVHCDCGEKYKRVVAALKKKDRYCGCSVCNREKMAETIKQKNHERGKRNKKMPIYQNLTDAFTRSQTASTVNST